VPSRVQRLVDAAKKSLPEGTFAVGAGLIIAGLTAYGFQILAGNELPKADYAALNALWAIVFVVTPGFFQPIEQEVSRALASRNAQGIGGGPLVRRAALLGGGLAAGVAIASIVFSQPLIDDLFNGETMLFVALLVAIATYYVAHLTRGTLSGNGRFERYGMLQGTEGSVRLLFCIALVIAGVQTAGMYGLALAVPPAIAAAVALRGQHHLLRPGPEAPYSEISNALALLLVGSFLAQTLGYAAFLGANILANPDQKDAVADFIFGLFIARIPILLFQAVQAALLPKLAGLAGAGKVDDFRSGLRKLVIVVSALAVLGTVAGATLGPWAGQLLFGSEDFSLSHSDLALLAAGSGCFILALTLAQALIALEGYAQAALAWLAGIVVFVVVAALGDDLFLRVELGFLAGALAASAAMAALLLARLRRGVPRTVEPLVRVIEHEPLEI
jgi:O-antigen/teichoic acid export membrane protein